MPPPSSSTPPASPPLPSPRAPSPSPLAPSPSPPPPYLCPRRHRLNHHLHRLLSEAHRLRPRFPRPRPRRPRPRPDRPGPHPQVTARARAEVSRFFGACAPEVTLVTGNHDPDISNLDTLDLCDGQVFVTHGDIIFDNIVPWGRDAATLEAHITRGLASLPVEHRTQLAPRLAVFRAACAALPQRHQSEPNPLKYAVKFAADTVWPPWRSFEIIHAWRETPNRAAIIAAAHRPAARFMLIGHTHRPFVWTAPSGLTVINTGALCRPFGAQAVDLTPGRLIIRQIDSRSGSFHPGRVVAEFALAEVPASSNIPA